MNFDRNTVIGFIVLALLFFGFFYYNNQQQLAYEKQKAHQDSILNANKPKPNPTALKVDSTQADSIQRASQAGDFATAVNGSEQITNVENSVFKIGFTNKGCQPKFVELKKYKGPDSTNVKLASTNYDRISYTIFSAANTSADVANFYFANPTVVNNADSSQTVSFQLSSGAKSIVHQFTIRPNDYMIDFNILINGVS